MIGNDYLWDRSGTPDVDVERLERVLGDLGRSWPVPELRPLSRPVRSFTTVKAFALLAAAAVAFVVVRVLWTPWIVTTADGSRRVGDGDVIATAAGSRALLEVGVIGRVEIAPASRLRVVNANAWQHHLALEVGSLRATIDAPPRWFLVDIPGARAIDLGCIYTLDVDANGNGVLRVQEGWVQLERAAHESIVPAGAAARIRSVRGPGSPYYEDASIGFIRALETIDFGPRAGLDAALADLFNEARTRDSITLLSLLRSVDTAHRSQIYDRLASLLPPPPDVTRQVILAGDQDALDRWWERLELERPAKTIPRLWKLVW